MKKIIFLILIITINLSYPLYSYAFTRIVDLVFAGESVKPEDLNKVFETIKINKKKNKKNPNKKLPDKLIIVHARQPNPKNIQLEIDTSEVIVKNENDIQAPISNQGFLNAVQESIMLWESIPIADVSFAPLKFASGVADPQDGKNIITFRAAKAPEGVPEDTNIVSIITYARTDKILFMNKEIKIKPGTILDADIVYDPSNDPCLELYTTQGDFKIGGDTVAISEGGIDSTADLSACEFIEGDDITDLAVSSIGSVLGLDSSAIPSSATSRVTKNMNRYTLANDDIIGLANIYPNKENLDNHGIVKGRVLLNKKSVRGAHVVLEDTANGEPIVSAITNIGGRFEIKAVPAGIYNVYAEPLDGPIRKNSFFRNFFGFTSQLNFTTSEYPTPILVRVKKTKKLTINVRELSASAFNINYLTVALNENDVNEFGGGFLLPIRIMPGETLTSVEFWGDNVSSGFGSLSVSGQGITVSNTTDASIPISPFVECEECTDTDENPCKRDTRCPPTHEITAEPDQIQGFTVDITCSDDAMAGPRNIIYTGSELDITHPSFGLRDQITGGIVVLED